MLTIRKSDERGLADHGWLKSYHTFSFANYYDPKYMGFRNLRVINQDRIAAGTGFGSHPHRDMEIISYVLEGALEHKDSMGNVAIIKPGEVQKMSAGTGVIHSEQNAKKDQETKFFQIWVMPNAQGGNPSYGQKSFEKELAENKIVHVISNDGRNGTISIKQDANMYISRLKSGEDITFPIKDGRGVWVQVIKGDIGINDQFLSEGDAATSEETQDLKIKASTDSELIIFDL